jgi:GNAT superfamily N-acetyltransferase
MKKLIRDRRGRVLEFSQERLDGLVYFKLEFKTVCAAYVNCQIDGEVLVLVDIFVEDNCVVRHPDWLKRLFGHKTLTVNFRNQGIGGQLLATVTAYAKSKGLKRVEASLAEKDLHPHSQLSRWYEKRGFTVRESGVFKDLVPLARDDSRYMPKA